MRKKSYVLLPLLLVAALVMGCANTAPLPTPETSAGATQGRGPYGTQNSPLAYGIVATYDGQGWNLAEAPYTLNITLSDAKRGSDASEGLSEGEGLLPTLNAGEEYFVVSVKVNLISSKDNSSVDFSKFVFAFADQAGQTLMETKLMGELDSSQSMFSSGGYVETTLVGKTKSNEAPFLVFQPSVDQGLWLSTQ